MQYFVKKAYAQIILSIDQSGDGISVYIISDELRDVDGLLKLEIIDFKGNSLWKKEKTIKVTASSCKAYFEIDKNLLPSKTNYPSTVCVVSLYSKDTLLNQKLYYFVPIKSLQLLQPDITVDLSSQDGNPMILLKSNVLAKNLYLYLEKGETFFSDNYFDLLPGKEKAVFYKPIQNSQISKENLKILTVNGIMH